MNSMTLLEQIQNSFWSVSRLIFSIPGPEYCFHFSEFQTCFFFFFLQQRCECKYVWFFLPLRGSSVQTDCVCVCFCLFLRRGLRGQECERSSVDYLGVILGASPPLSWELRRREREGRVSLPPSLAHCNWHDTACADLILRVFFFRATTTTCDLSVYVVMSD